MLILHLAGLIIKSNLDEATMQGLAFCADTFNRHTEEFAISNDELSHLTSELEKLNEDVLQSDIHDDLKAILIEQLEKMRHAIIYYRLLGNRGIEEALGSIMFTVLRYQDDIKRQGKLAKRLFKFVDFVDKILSIASKAPRLLGPLMTNLLPGE